MLQPRGKWSDHQKRTALQSGHSLSRKVAVAMSTITKTMNSRSLAIARQIQCAIHVCMTYSTSSRSAPSQLGCLLLAYTGRSLRRSDMSEVGGQPDSLGTRRGGPVLTQRGHSFGIDFSGATLQSRIALASSKYVRRSVGIQRRDILRYAKTYCSLPKDVQSPRGGA
jgi:hypothetical protein